MKIKKKIFQNVSEEFQTFKECFHDNFQQPNSWKYHFMKLSSKMIILI